MKQSLPRAASLLILSCSLVATAVAQRKALDALPPNADAVTQALPDGAHPTEAIVLPGKGPVRAVACGKADLWVVRDEVLVMTTGTRKLRRRLPVPEGLLGLAADDRFFYVLQEDAIAILEPRTARELRRIALPKHNGKPPVAIGAHAQEIFVAWPDRFVAVHKGTSKLRECTLPFESPRWLAGDRTSLWGGGTRGFARVDTSERAKRVTPRSLPKPFESILATMVNNRLMVVQSRPVAGKPIQAAFVTTARPVPEGEQLGVALRCGEKAVSYQVGPKPIANSDGVARELKRIRRDPSCMVPGPGGKPVPMPVQLVVYPGVKVKELAAIWDLVIDAGFPTVTCVSHNARPKRQVQEPPPLPPGWKKL